MQHIYKGTADCLKKVRRRGGRLPPASTKASLLMRSAVSAVPWCWCSTTEPRTYLGIAFNKAFIEKQSLFHCALSPQTQVNNVAKTSLQHQAQKRAADSRTSDRQARRKTDAQSAEPRPRPQYSKYTPDGTLISLLQHSWLFLEQVLGTNLLNAVHCCYVWGCYKKHPRWEH